MRRLADELDADAVQEQVELLQIKAPLPSSSMSLMRL